MSTRNDAYICLGSNEGNCPQNLQKARTMMAGLDDCEFLAASSIYLTEPWGYGNQPWFHNQVIKLRAGCFWQPETFLAALLNIENLLGRKRSPDLRYGPRIIDIDLLLFGDESRNAPFCILPHPRMLARAFVLAPLMEIEPELIVNGKKVREWLDSLSWRMDNNKIFQHQ